MNLDDSLLYKIFQAEKEEISKHKWLESEKAGYDIGYNQAVLSWTRFHKRDWRLKELAEIRATFSGGMSQIGS